MRRSDVEGLKPPAGRGRGFAIPVGVTVPPSHVVSASDPPRETDEALEQRSAVIRAAPAEQLLYTKATAPARSDAKDARRPIKGVRLSDEKQIQPPVGHGRGRGLTLPDTEKARKPFGRGARLLQALAGYPALKPAPGAPVFVEPDALRSSVFELPEIVPSPPEPLYDHPVPIPPYNWPPRASTVAASKELSLELDKEAMRTLVQAQKNVILSDMNTALSDTCKRFREENAEKDREIISLKLKNERANQRLIQATAPEAHMFYCDLCDHDIKLTLSQHMRLVHLPWYTNYFLTCFVCKLPLKAERDLNGSEHSAHHSRRRGSLSNWLRLCAGLIYHLCDILESTVPLLPQLLVERKFLLPDNTAIAETSEGLLACWDLLDKYLNFSSSSRYSLSVPSHPSVILHPLILYQVLKSLPVSVSVSVKSFMQPSPSAVTELVLPRMIVINDSHCHLRRVFKRFRVPATAPDRLQRLRQLSQDQCTSVQVIVNNIVFPSDLSDLRIVEEGGVVLTFGCHPLADWTSAIQEQFEPLCDGKVPARLKAIGETGFDSSRLTDDDIIDILKVADGQYEKFHKQVSLAVQLNLTLVLHLRARSETEFKSLMSLMLDALSSVLTTASSRAWIWRPISVTPSAPLSSL